MKSIILAASLFFSWTATASTEIGQRVQGEFSRLRAVVSQLTPEFQVGGYLNGKSYGDHEILWALSEDPSRSEVIRIYREKGANEQPMVVSFHRSTLIAPGRTVIRRFVGPGLTGWRNDTVDVDSGEYLGSQGNESPLLDARDREILKKWDIELP